MMNVIVCIKQVADPEAPASVYSIDEGEKQVILKGVMPVISPFDENALEAALRIKDTFECKVTAISAGYKLSKPVLMKALAIGADELILLDDEAFQDMDGYATASTLAAAIKKIGQYDLIITGRQSADTDAGIVGSGIAEILGIPSITVVRKVELADDKVKAERVVSDGIEVIEAPLPCLVTVSAELGEMRSATLQQIIAAKKIPIASMTSQEIGIDPSQLKQSTLMKLFVPQRETKCLIVEGNTPEEASANLAVKLHEDKIL
jgi:electron transfer flavoprotein beta subunit